MMMSVGGRIARGGANKANHGHGYDDESADAVFSSSCVLCHAHDFCKDTFGDRTVMICDQCEKEYHVGCLREHGVVDLTVSDCLMDSRLIKSMVARIGCTLRKCVHAA